MVRHSSNFAPMHICVEMIMMPLDSLLSSLSGLQVNSRYCKSAFSVLRGKYRFVQHNSFFIEVALLPKVGPQC